jgi:dolichol-phosphate mannosyltransferase
MGTYLKNILFVFHMRVCIVLPTYNEKDNIALLLEKIRKVAGKIGRHSLSVLVVDDNSPDGTAEVVRREMKRGRGRNAKRQGKGMHGIHGIYLLRGRKKGLGVAYIRGFSYCIRRGFDVVFEMDSDLSHDPGKIREFMKNIDRGYDIVIGSRYIRGGKIKDWNFLRKLISRGGNFFARFVAGLLKVRDCTSGFRAIRVSMLRKTGFENMSSRGYSFQMELLYRLVKIGARIKEVPIVFVDRKAGSTKLGFGDILEFFFHAFRLRFSGSKGIREQRE